MIEALIIMKGKGMNSSTYTPVLRFRTLWAPGILEVSRILIIEIQKTDEIESIWRSMD